MSQVEGRKDGVQKRKSEDMKVKKRVGRRGIQSGKVLTKSPARPRMVGKVKRRTGKTEF